MEEKEGEEEEEESSKTEKGFFSSILHKLPSPPLKRQFLCFCTFTELARGLVVVMSVWLCAFIILVFCERLIIIYKGQKPILSIKKNSLGKKKKIGLRINNCGS